MRISCSPELRYYVAGLILRESEHKYKQLIEIQPVIFWKYIVGEKKLDYVSEEAVKVLGYSKTELMNVELVLDKMFYPEDRNRILREFYQGLKSKKRFTLKYRSLSKSGKEIWFKDYISSKIIEGNVEVIGLKIDVTEDQEKERKISQLAFFDSMTKLPNRVKLMEHLSKSIKSACKKELYGAALSLDLDSSKYRVDNTKIILELTESIGISDFEATLKKMKQIKELGFKIAIDDFGTGYSSLNYLTSA